MRFSKYEFVIRPEQEFILPRYKGSTFRGGFGHVLKRSVCRNGSDGCENCVFRGECIYSYVFETSVFQTGDKGTVLKRDYVPRPFIIEPPLDGKQHYSMDDCLVFHLVLIGRAVDYIPYFIFAFEELGRKGIGKNRDNYLLEEVLILNKNNEKTLIYDGKSHCKDNFWVIDSAELIREANQLNYHRVTLRFLTPTRIKYSGKLVIDLNFEILIRNLLRRLSRIAEVHCDEKWELEWNELIKRAKENVDTVHSELKWCDWERYSQRQGTKMKMGGFIGGITFEGDIAEFMPFLKLGEHLHIGKGTVYGLGKYELTGE